MKHALVARLIHGSWDAQAAFYAAAASLCLLSLKAQATWRLSSEWLVKWLPWLGTALFVVSLLVLISHVLSGARGLSSEDEPAAHDEGADFEEDADFGEDEENHAAPPGETRPGRPAGEPPAASAGLLDDRPPLLRIVHGCGTALVWLFIAFGAFVFVNGKFDGGPASELRARVDRISRNEIYVGEFFSYAWAVLSPREPGQSAMTVLLTADERPHRWGGEPVIAKVHPGLLGVPWLSALARDEETLNLAILERLPNAAQPRNELMRYYVGRKEWGRAEEAARGYLAVYPGGYRDVSQVGSRLSVARDNKRALPFHRLVFETHKDYDTYNLYGWALSKVGRHEEAVTLLQASIPLDDKQFWAFYHLGYTYLSMRRRPEALAMFQEVLERRPQFPEIENQVARLRQPAK